MMTTCSKEILRVLMITGLTIQFLVLKPSYGLTGTLMLPKRIWRQSPPMVSMPSVSLSGIGHIITQVRLTYQAQTIISSEPLVGPEPTV